MEHRDGIAAFVLATLGVLAAATATTYLLFAPAYSNGDTVLEGNPETQVLVAVLAPAAVALVIWLSLARTCRTGSRLARAAGTGAAWLLTAFAILTGFTIGMFVMPSALLLTAAAAVTPGPAR